MLVDASNLAQQFNLAEARIGDQTLQLPASVNEVAFSPGGLRVLFSNLELGAPREFFGGWPDLAGRHTGAQGAGQYTHGVW